MDIKNVKIPPNSLDSEQSVLGGLLLHNDAWDQVADILTEVDFYNASHRIIFEAISTLMHHDKPADILTVKEHVKKTGNEETIGGFVYLAQIAENTPSISNIEAYAKHVRELSVYRQLIVASHEIADTAYNPKEMEVQELIDLSEKKIFEIAEQVTRGKKDITNVKDIIKDVVNRVHEMQETEGVTGLETGFTELDKITSGLQNGDLIIIAGRPSMGKTAFSMNIIEHVAITAKEPKPVAVFSLEMPTEALVMRMISSFGHIKGENLKDTMTETDWNSFNHAVLALEKSTILIDETPSITPTEIRAKCRRLKRQYPDLALIMVDYLQLMVVHGKTDNRVQEISEISRSLKALAKEINVPVIALSQLNRGVESRPKAGKGRMPQMSDLRESGSIEQDADIIGFIYRDQQYHDDSYSNPEEIGKADLKIAKHRNGSTGSIKLAFIGEYARFEDLANEDQFQGIPDEHMDAAYNNNMANFDQEPF
ncbi:Replicative DNA helicase (DnaB) [Bathymodiolus heckerae thiotrophic gill symbiont]|uniref:replicative DNA helicase n=1 Tax=Bathymodiolus heckerae thiotrophic gill symbiont TaxID=1052212 RepID=UPI0010B2BC22|nr:replicative DNA helicase [Bathymodiolus heckerae thiotrophic gill symbiont]CAC9528091.1 Replicative DNA helicase (DnaB) (EC 3.6.4.12) [uncultured Gammaproteobacteria bacterium]SHN90737.1 Replicative DNA helicase (DnaB) [Bathymodiolus heckerae thiotrophic gill symbiont]